MRDVAVGIAPLGTVFGSLIQRVLSLVKQRKTMRNLFVVDAKDLHDALLYTHVFGLSRFTSQVSFDTLEPFVGQNCLDDFVQGVPDDVGTVSFSQEGHFEHPSN